MNNGIICVTASQEPPAWGQLLLALLIAGVVAAGPEVVLHVLEAWAAIITIAGLDRRLPFSDG